MCIFGIFATELLAGSEFTCPVTTGVLRGLNGRVRQLVERLCGFWAAGITAEAPLLKEAPYALASGTGL
ncbi:hypothetical protein E6H37_02015 [Candidatus Bathyarchaeota archaeon]|nr:MAG: hypothetical protein E6H37_02015 [Candidatus Bathyarchaeota archaeon]